MRNHRKHLKSLQDEVDRLAATASGSRERRREATGVPKQQATDSYNGTGPVSKVIGVIHRIAEIIGPLSRLFPL